MICKQCNNNIDNSALICPRCGLGGPLAEAREEYEELKRRRDGLTRSAVHSPMFLIFTVCFSIMTVFNIVSIFSGSYGELLPTVFMLIATINMWISYFRKDNLSLSKSLKGSSVYDAYYRVIYTVSLILTVILTVLGIVLSVLIFGVKTSGDSNIPTGILVAALILCVGIVAIFVICLFRRVFARRRDFFIALGDYAASGRYEPVRVAIFGDCVIGAAYALGGVALILAFVLVQGILGSVGSLGDSFEGTPIAALIPLLVGMLSGLGTAGIAKIAFGIYYILSAVWIVRTHKAMLALRSELDHSNVRRLELERRAKELASNTAKAENALCESEIQSEAAPEIEPAADLEAAPEIRPEEEPAFEEIPEDIPETASEIPEAASEISGISAE